jgi:hypothetical protein
MESRSTAPEVDHANFNGGVFGDEAKQAGQGEARGYPPQGMQGYV